eukprot:COSAG01_NODE_3684_length_5798_cov_2.534129_2_plen_867_part_00
MAVRLGLTRYERHLARSLPAARFYNVSKTLAPDLHVIDTDGCCWVHGANVTMYSKAEGAIDGAEVCGSSLGSLMGAGHSAGACARHTADFMTPFYGYTTPLIYPLMYDNVAGGDAWSQHADNLLICRPNLTTNPTCAPPKPLISHEAGNFGVFPNLTANILDLAGSLNFDPGPAQQTLASMRAQHLEAELDSWIITSTQHAFESWKVTLEYLRLQPYIAGHEWWLLYDWATVHNGLVDLGFRPKGHALAPDQIRSIVNPVVLLLGNGSLWKPSATGASGEHGYLSGERIAPTVFVSNYAQTELNSCVLSWTVSTGADSSAGMLHNGSFSVVGVIEQGAVQAVKGADSLAFALDVTQPTRFTLALALRCNAADLPRLTIVRNQWTAWVYPAHPSPVAPTAVPIFASPSLLSQLREIGVAPHVQPMPTVSGSGKPPLSKRAVYIVEQDAVAAPALLAAIHGGATALLISWNESAHQQTVAQLSPKNVIFHSPTWTQATNTPAALLVRQTNTTPATLRALASPSGWADTAFFEAFGPKPGRCGGFRVGRMFDVSRGLGPLLPPEPPAPNPPGTWQGPFHGSYSNVTACEAVGGCPPAFLFPSPVFQNVLCYKTAEEAKSGAGPCGSWCTKKIAVGEGCGDNHQHLCKSSSCPSTYPFLVAPGTPNSQYVLCYKTHAEAARGTSSCDSWCASAKVWPIVKAKWGKCGEQCPPAPPTPSSCNNSGGTTTSLAACEKLCDATPGCTALDWVAARSSCCLHGCPAARLGPPSRSDSCCGYYRKPLPPSPPLPPPPPPAPIDVWLRVVLTTDAGGPVQNMASVFASHIGEGSLIVSGLDLDLRSCKGGSNSMTVFAKWVVKALIQAAVDRVAKY